MTCSTRPLLYVHGNHDPLAEYSGRDGTSQKAGPKAATTFTCGAPRWADAGGPGWRAASTTALATPTSTPRATCGCGRPPGRASRAQPAGQRPLPGHPGHPLTALRHPRRSGRRPRRLPLLSYLHAILPAALPPARHVHRFHAGMPSETRFAETTSSTSTRIASWRSSSGPALRVRAARGRRSVASRGPMPVQESSQFNAIYGPGLREARNKAWAQLCPRASHRPLQPAAGL